MLYAPAKTSTPDNGMAQANSWSHIYCLENCMFLDAQLNAYSTGVMFKANMDIAPDRVFNEMAM